MALVVAWRVFNYQANKPAAAQTPSQQVENTLRGSLFAVQWQPYDNNTQSAGESMPAEPEVPASRATRQPRRRCGATARQSLRHSDSRLAAQSSRRVVGGNPVSHALLYLIKIYHYNEYEQRRTKPKSTNTNGEHDKGVLLCTLNCVVVVLLCSTCFS